jgi:hypothetical protein
MKKILATVFGILCFTAPLAQGQGTTAFTYQGRLNDGVNLASGAYDLTFALYDASSGGGQLGSTITNTGTSLSNGLFTVTLDFGANYPGASRWLEVGVRTNGGGAFTTMPRQQLTPAPYALTASNATALATQLAGSGTINQGGNPVDWTQLKSVPAAIASGTVGSVTSVTAGTGLSGGTITSSGTISLADTGPGGGSYTLANITLDSKGRVTAASSSSSIDAGFLQSGIVPDGRIGGTYSSPVTLNNANNSFTGSFTGNGAGITNLPIIPDGYAYATNGTWGAVFPGTPFPISGLGTNSGWSLSGLTLTVAKTGLYLIQYKGTVFTCCGTGAIDIGCTKNGTTIDRCVLSAFNSGVYYSFSGFVLVGLTANDAIQIKNLNLPVSVDPGISVSIIRVK